MWRHHVATTNTTSAAHSLNASAALRMVHPAACRVNHGDGSDGSTACWEVQQVLQAKGCRRTLPFIVWRQRAVKRISWRFRIFSHRCYKENDDRWRFFHRSDSRFTAALLVVITKGNHAVFWVSFLCWQANRKCWDEAGRRQEMVWVMSAWLDRMLWAGTGVEHCPEIQTRLTAKTIITASAVPGKYGRVLGPA